MNYSASVCVAKVVEEIQRLLSIKADENSIQLLTEIDPKLPGGLMLDEVRLRQVLFNVVGNALKFTEKGQVKTRAWAESGSTGAPPVGSGAPPNPTFNPAVPFRTVFNTGVPPTGEAPVGAPGASAGLGSLAGA